MIFYVNPQAVNNTLSQIHPALHDRFFASLEKQAAGFGITAVESAPGIIRGSLAGMRQPQDLFAFMNEAAVEAVDVEPGDVLPLLGRSVDTLALKRGLESGELSLTKLMPDELWDALQSARLGCTTVQPNEEDLENGVADFYAEVAEQELLNAGLLTPSEANALRDWDAQEERDRKAPPEGDLSDYFPDPRDTYDPFKD